MLNRKIKGKITLIESRIKMKKMKNLTKEIKQKSKIKRKMMKHETKTK
jgi:predicted RNA-binding protein